MDAHLRGPGEMPDCGPEGFLLATVSLVAADYGDTREPIWSLEMDGGGKPNLPYNKSSQFSPLSIVIHSSFFIQGFAIQNHTNFVCVCVCVRTVM